jgi:hypothetical protein
MHRCRSRHAGTGCHHEHANFSARARITGGHEAGGLFVGRYHEVDLPLGRVLVHFVETKHSVVCWQNRAAAITEDGIDALLTEYAQDDVGTRHRFAGKRWFRGDF